MVFPLIARHAAVRCSVEGELGPVRKRSTAASSRARMKNGNVFVVVMDAKVRNGQLLSVCMV